MFSLESFASPATEREVPSLRLRILARGAPRTRRALVCPTARCFAAISILGGDGLRQPIRRRRAAKASKLHFGTSGETLESDKDMLCKVTACADRGQFGVIVSASMISPSRHHATTPSNRAPARACANSVGGPSGGRSSRRATRCGARRSTAGSARGADRQRNRPRARGIARAAISPILPVAGSHGGGVSVRLSF